MRGYTQEELAQELSVSRNAIGMIERGIIRPSDDLVDCLANKLWIDKRWLLTGTGSMEKVELTPFYELLRRDPEVRAHIRSFIDHLEHSSREVVNQSELDASEKGTEISCSPGSPDNRP